MALDCAGLSDFYKIWTVEVLLIPLTLLAFLLGFYFYRRGVEGATIALGKLCSEAFFLLFVVYPFVVTRPRVEAVYWGQVTGSFL